nr:MAG TPA: hypothetical protein [Caudoviricetes sp.]
MTCFSFHYENISFLYFRNFWWEWCFIFYLLVPFFFL